MVRRGGGGGGMYVYMYFRPILDTCTIIRNNLTWSSLASRQAKGQLSWASCFMLDTICAQSLTVTVNTGHKYTPTDQSPMPIILGCYRELLFFMRRNVLFYKFTYIYILTMRFQTVMILLALLTCTKLLNKSITTIPTESKPS